MATQTQSVCPFNNNFGYCTHKDMCRKFHLMSFVNANSGILKLANGTVGGMEADKFADILLKISNCIKNENILKTLLSFILIQISKL